MSNTSECIMPIPQRMRVLTNVLCRKIQSFCATLQFDSLSFLLNGIIQTFLVAFSMKMSMAYTGMLSYENDALKFSKSVKTTKCT